ncbi:MAG: cysteine--tRNA ligase, partial [Actinomycetales bacterium]
MTFKLYDTATGQIQVFEPLLPGQVSIYHCGLTLQSAPHVGHIRKEVVFDVLRRWLTYCGYQVDIVANVTDIDDKILAKSAERDLPWYSHAYEFERELHTAYQSLGCLPPTYEPRATGHIPEMIELISQLIASNHAYIAEDGSGDVYFEVATWPKYGSLSRQNIADMESAADADLRGKKDPRDFALWKGHKPGEPITASWQAPWGRGRPGWHIECSAMAGKYLGDTFDIHGGGIDLRFPHHENEQAQSQAAGRGFARYWMHNGWVTAAGEKMSKSLGNGALVSEVTKLYPPRAVRLYLVAPHYRSTVEFSDTSLAEATASLA